MENLQSTDMRMSQQKLANQYKTDMVGKTFRHFKGNLYKVIDIGIHSETSDIYVIYNSCADGSLVWVRPYDMFVSEVDRDKYPLDKYPEITQKFRFEQID